MDALRIQQAKTVLDQCINEYFDDAEPNKESWQCMRMHYQGICDLLNVVDHLLHEGLSAEPN